LAIASLSCVELEEQFLGDSDESFVANLPRFALRKLPQQQAGSLMLLGIAQRLE